MEADYHAIREHILFQQHVDDRTCVLDRAVHGRVRVSVHARAACPIAALAN